MANNAHELATPKQVASELGISTSTLRVWSTRFASILTSTANPPKDAASGRVGMRRYAPSDVAILARARDLLAPGGRTFSEVLTILRTEQPQPLVAQEPRDLATPDLARALVILADQKDQLADLQRRVSDLESRDRRPWWRFW